MYFRLFFTKKKLNIKPKTCPQHGKPSALICKDHKKQFLNNFHNQYVNLFLPLARLLLRTFLPSAVLILFLKPCSFFLCLFFGWYVLSILRHLRSIYSITFSYKAIIHGLLFLFSTRKKIKRRHDLYYNHKITFLSIAFIKFFTFVFIFFSSFFDYKNYYHISSALFSPYFNYISTFSYLN